MRFLQIIFLTIPLLNLFGCGVFGHTVNLGESFTLKTNESATVRGAGIKVTLNRIGRKWGTKPIDGESLDLSFSVKREGKVENFTESSRDPITAGKYKIEVVKTEPFGEGYAIFVVNKSDSNDAVAAEFVEKFGWHIDEEIAPEKIPLEIPVNFDSPAFSHYQSASKSSGLDLTALQGKTVELSKYTLREKQFDDGREFAVFACLIIKNGKVVGAWRADSSRRVPGIYSFAKK